jgi:cysteine sulfinate desulfinase/cysteine desulfurase-like protein
MGLPAARATTSARVSLGAETTAHDTAAAATAFEAAVAAVRAAV